MSKKHTNITSTVELDLKKYKDKTIESIMKEIDFVITHTEREAIAALKAVTKDQLARDSKQDVKFITIDGKITDKGLTGTVGVEGGESDLAAYIEFGTGLSAQQILAPYPQWVRDIAMEFWKTGKGTLKGTPYLYNNFLKNLEVFKKNITSITTKTEVKTKNE